MEGINMNINNLMLKYEISEYTSLDLDIIRKKNHIGTERG